MSRPSPLILLLFFLFTVRTATAQTPLIIYTDSLVNGFDDWSWSQVHNMSSTGTTHAGANAIGIYATNWQGVSFHHADLDTAAYTNLSFWAHGGPLGGQRLQIYCDFSSGPAGTTYSLPSALTANTWTQFTVSLAALGATNRANLSRINLQLTPSGTTNFYYLDDVQLTAGPVPPQPLVHISVNAAQTIRAADARWFGLNTAVWDSDFDSASTSNALAELGTTLLRFPGGSLSDEYHWATGTTLANTWTWSTTFKNFLHIATNAGVSVVITVNYGTGTTNEAAGWVRHCNVTNHFNFKYWEIGNENYGTWETDTNNFPHDPYTYAVRAAQYLTQMRAADPTIKIGIPVVPGENTYADGYTNHPAYNARTGTTNNGWTPVVLATLKTLGAKPDFLVHHVYPQYLNDNDAGLLQASANWATDAAGLRQQITDYFGSSGTNIELLCTENNADAGNQGRQSTSIVNGLYLADSLAQLMKTEINSFVWWDLRNGSDTGGDFNASLYGWRNNGDLGIIGGANTRYPTFYGFKLMQFFARPGDTILNSTSDYNLLSSYAARKANGALALLIINKNGTTNLNAQITLTNFFPWSTATTRSFGIAQDEATRTNSVVPGAQDIATNSFANAGTNFSASFPAYTMTLFTFAPAAPKLQTLSAPNGNFVFQVQGQSGVPYQIQTSTNLSSWISNATVTLSGATANVTNTLSSPWKFWRAVWLP